MVRIVVVIRSFAKYNAFSVCIQICLFKTILKLDVFQLFSFQVTVAELLNEYVLLYLVFLCFKIICLPYKQKLI